MTTIEVGKKAPDFELRDDSGSLVRLSSLKGRPVVLFFYPEDDTPGCTQQACGYRDEHEAIAALDAVVLGMSADSVESHAAFRKKYGFPFQLLSDPENRVAIAYGSFGEKQMYGNTVVGTIRSSIVIDAAGNISSIHRNVRTAGNATRMLAALQALRAD